MPYATPPNPNNIKVVTARAIAAQLAGIGIPVTQMYQVVNSSTGPAGVFYLDNSAFVDDGNAYPIYGLIWGSTTPVCLGLEEVNIKTGGYTEILQLAEMLFADPNGNPAVTFQNALNAILNLPQGGKAGAPTWLSALNSGLTVSAVTIA